MCLPLCGRDIAAEGRRSGGFGSDRGVTPWEGKELQRSWFRARKAHPIPCQVSWLAGWNIHITRKSSTPFQNAKQSETYSSHIFYYIYGQYKYNPRLAQVCLTTLGSWFWIPYRQSGTPETYWWFFFNIKVAFTCKNSIISVFIAQTVWNILTASLNTSSQNLGVP